jgi:hypothetical protein
VAGADRAADPPGRAAAATATARGLAAMAVSAGRGTAPGPAGPVEGGEHEGRGGGCPTGGLRANTLAAA